MNTPEDVRHGNTWQGAKDEKNGQVWDYVSVTGYMGKPFKLSLVKSEKGKIEPSCF